jgi:hypothetical protein
VVAPLPESLRAPQHPARGQGASHPPRSGTIPRTVTAEHTRGAMNVVPRGAAPGERIGDPRVQDRRVVAPKCDDLRVEEPMLEELRLKDPRVEEPKLVDPRVGVLLLGAVAEVVGEARIVRASR